MILQPTVLIALAMALPKIQCASVCDNINNIKPDNKVDTPLEIGFDCIVKHLAEKGGISVDDTKPVETLLEVPHYKILTIKF